MERYASEIRLQAHKSLAWFVSKIWSLLAHYLFIRKFFHELTYPCDNVFYERFAHLWHGFRSSCKHSALMFYIECYRRICFYEIVFFLLEIFSNAFLDTEDAVLKTLLISFGFLKQPTGSSNPLSISAQWKFWKKTFIWFRTAADQWMIFFGWRLNIMPAANFHGCGWKILPHLLIHQGIA